MNTAVELDFGSVSEVYQHLKDLLYDVVPDMELQYKAELAYEIICLKHEKNAVILGHNYMEPALFHSIPDFRGDSLELCRAAAAIQQEMIVFCGVRFMAETAKILNPEKRVLIPSLKAGCSLANGITAEDVRKLKAKFPGIPVVAYVNTNADVKAEADVCCTSGNAAEIVRSLDSPTVIFVPDEFLARNVARETRKTIIFPDSNGAASHADQPGIIGWKARCEVHDKFSVDDIRAIRKQFPDVLILAHPECSPEVVEASDFSGSTSAMVRYVSETNAPRYLLLTECSMGDNIAASNPEKEMLRLCSVRCPHMNQITLEDTLEALRLERYEVHLDSEIIRRAQASVNRMLALS